jgi:hypothetical protein
MDKPVIYRAAYESHHVAYIEEFESYDRAASFLHGRSVDVHSWPVGIFDREGNRLWLWCGYRTMGINSETALEDARAILGLPAGHQFAAVEVMAEDL